VGQYFRDPLAEFGPRLEAAVVEAQQAPFEQRE
jgi:hypothetical protein